MPVRLCESRRRAQTGQVTQDRAAAPLHDAARSDSVPELVVGLVAAPGATGSVARQVRGDVLASLAQQVPTVRWDVHLVVDPLVDPPADTSELVEAGRRLLLEHDWDLVVCLTDLPVQAGRRPVIAHASPMHGVGLVSVPALGAVGVRRRTGQVVLRLLRSLLGDDEPGSRQPLHRARALATDADDRGDGFGFAARVVSGHLRLLLGMVVANQPWRLAAQLSRALVAAIAAGVFALVTSDVWRLADAFGVWRHLLATTASVVGITATLIVGASLWERAPDRRVRQQVLLFNAATTLTVLLGVAALYLALFVLGVLTGGLLVVPDLLAEALGHPVGIGDYAELAWLTSSLATAGGALGAGLESDQAVRAAAYRHHTHEEVGAER